MFDTRHRILNSLECGGNSDDLLDTRVHSFRVIVPINDLRKRINLE
jgi:hypothetical protein